MPEPTLVCADSIKHMAQLEPESVDALITDPPYGIGFMGKEWDTFKAATVEKVRKGQTVDRSNYDNPNLRGRKFWTAGAAVRYDETLEGHRKFQEWTREWATAALPALKPGANVLVCSSPRTAHRVTSGLEDAGFEIRHVLLWLYGQGYPKNKKLAPGVGTALKPAYEPLILARTPSPDTMTVTYGKHGTGGLNIQQCRLDGNLDGHWSHDDGTDRTSRPGYDGGFDHGGSKNDAGRWPGDVLIDEAFAAELDGLGERRSGAAPKKRYVALFSDRVYSGGFKGRRNDLPAGRDENAGGISRYFYCPKASVRERERGCEQLPLWAPARRVNRQEGSAGIEHPRAGAGRGTAGANHHPTVKPLELMRWLVRLLTLPSATVLDPFMGSGTTGMACALEGRGFVGIDREPEYIEIAQARIRAVGHGGPLFYPEGT